MARIDAFDDLRIKSSVVQLFGLHPSMGPEVVWDSQVGKASERGRGGGRKKRKEKKIPEMLSSPGKTNS